MLSAGAITERKVFMMKLPEISANIDLTNEEAKSVAAFSVLISFIAALVAVLTFWRLVWNMLRFFKEARKAIPVFREAAEIYIDEHDSCICFNDEDEDEEDD